MSFGTPLALLCSATFFYYKSDRRALSLAFSSIASLIALWSILLFVLDSNLNLEAKLTLAKLIPIPILFIPFLVNYIIRNYSNPDKLTSVPLPFAVAHVLAILVFSILSLFGIGSPIAFNGSSFYYRGGLTYNLSVTYIYTSLIWGLGRIIYNMVQGSYFEKLHSIYLFTGILCSCLFSAAFLLFITNQDLIQGSVLAFGFISFLWFSWIPVTKYKLFNVDLADFGKDHRNPRLSTIVITINRYLLNKIDPIGYKEICDKYEKLKQEELNIIQMSGIQNLLVGKITPITYLSDTSKKIIKLFFD
ncbi:histidine kinase N-terminal 7TM domain-containing protein [Leptospira licerasiae]|uniref:histidine kinase N-terminal 7TM domain-containing protein n=1 Tax=Leptospira licerasiae TaxID=447106 RepID=UPI003018C44C